VPTALLLKLTLAPALIAVATVVARRVSPRAGGMVSGLPVVAGPIVLIYAVEHGDRFAGDAAAAAVLGMISLVAFCAVDAVVARIASFVAALAASLLAFALATAALSGVDPPLGVSVLVTFAVISIGAWWLARIASGLPPQPRPRSDLLGWRMVITAALVVTLTALAGDLSAHLAGLLVPVPIITAVLAGFTQARVGAPATIELLSGLVFALYSFLAFFAVLALALVEVSAVAAFALASAAALGCWVILVRR
jgi:hypothetical protein